MDNKYCYPGTDILKNLPNIQDEQQLERFENIYSAKRLVELYKKPIEGKFDLKHLQKIHGYIFQDVYPFAGKPRTINIEKGTTKFCSAAYIEEQSKEIFGKLKAENYLKGLNKEEFVERFAYYMSEVNMIHPFREGNGRATREFMRVIAKNAGHEIQWHRLEPKKLLEVTIKSVLDTKELANYLTKAIDPPEVPGIAKQKSNLLER